MAHLTDSIRVGDILQLKKEHMLEFLYFKVERIETVRPLRLFPDRYTNISVSELSKEFYVLIVCRNGHTFHHSFSPKSILMYWDGQIQNSKTYIDTDYYS
jgi:hypothetical protein